MNAIGLLDLYDICRVRYSRVVIFIRVGEFLRSGDWGVREFWIYVYSLISREKRNFEDFLITEDGLIYGEWK